MKKIAYIQRLLRQFFSSKSVLILTLICTPLIDQKPSFASSENFTCSSTGYDGKTVPTTFVNPETGGRPVALILWVSDYFSGSGATPENRCEVVTGRLQAYYDNGYLNYIHSDTVNGLPVICISQNTDQCSESEIIMTLPPGIDSVDALSTLTNINQVRHLEPLELTDELVVYRRGEAYINFAVYVERARGLP
jgi:hypothetical protein